MYGPSYYVDCRARLALTDCAGATASPVPLLRCTNALHAEPRCYRTYTEPALPSLALWVPLLAPSSGGGGVTNRPETATCLNPIHRMTAPPLTLTLAPATSCIDVSTNPRHCMQRRASVLPSPRSGGAAISLHRDMCGTNNTSEGNKPHPMCII